MGVVVLGVFSGCGVWVSGGRSGVFSGLVGVLVWSGVWVCSGGLWEGLGKVGSGVYKKFMVLWKKVLTGGVWGWYTQWS